MKCISCTADIPFLFIHAFNSNICPSCGKAIMSEPTKVAFLSLQDAIKASDYPEQLIKQLSSLLEYCLGEELKKVSQEEVIEMATIQNKDNELEEEIEFYGQQFHGLLQTHLNKYVLIKNKKLLGSFNDAAAAYEFGMVKLGNVPMLIRQVISEQVPHATIPSFSVKSTEQPVKNVKILSDIQANKFLTRAGIKSLPQKPSAAELVKQIQDDELEAIEESDVLDEVDIDWATPEMDFGTEPQMPPPAAKGAQEFHLQNMKRLQQQQNMSDFGSAGKIVRR